MSLKKGSLAIFAPLEPLGWSLDWISVKKTLPIIFFGLIALLFNLTAHFDTILASPGNLTLFKIPSGKGCSLTWEVNAATPKPEATTKTTVTQFHFKKVCQIKKRNFDNVFDWYPALWIILETPCSFRMQAKKWKYFFSTETLSPCAWQKFPIPAFLWNLKHRLSLPCIFLKNTSCSKTFLCQAVTFQVYKWESFTALLLRCNSISKNLLWRNPPLLRESGFSQKHKSN